MFTKLIIVLSLLCCATVFGQLGVKSPIKSGNLINNSTTSGYKPLNYTNTTPLPFLPNQSTKDQFLNRTISNIAPGICFKEVP